MLNKLLKANPVHWDVIQGPVFLCDQPFMKDPPIWKHSIIVPIFKKDSSQSHCSISLLSSGAKLYTSYPYLKLEEWITSNNIHRWEQIGFRKGFETQDHCLILTHLDEKYTSPLRGRLYVAFIDLKRAFDTIPRSSLWGKLERTSIDKKLLWLIKNLYSSYAALVHCGDKGKVLKCFHLERGVKQDCLLAPLLFNLYLNDLTTALTSAEFHPCTYPQSY